MNATTIHNVRLQHSGRDPHIAQNAFSRLLACAEVHPAHLPPAAILCVRTLRDPLPRTLVLDAHALHAPTPWLAALAATLATMLHEAARPWHGPIPPAAPAVIFLDPAELLACLSREWLGNQLHLHWWWRSLFAKQVATSRSTRAIILEQWMDEGNGAPAALHKLHQRGEAVAFIQCLTRAESTALLARIIRHFGLRHLHAALDLAPHSPHHSPPTQDVALPPLESAARPWQQSLPDAASAVLLPDQEMLLGVALTLHHAPALARAPSFASEVAAWQRTHREQLVAPATVDNPHQARSGPPTIERRTQNPRTTKAQTPLHSAGQNRRATERSRTDAPRTRNSEAAPTHLPAARPFATPARASSAAAQGAPTGNPSPTVRDDEGTHLALSGAPDKAHLPTPNAPQSSESPRVRGEDAPRVRGEDAPLYDAAKGPESGNRPAADWEIEQIHTAYGGIFYLINLAILLGYYAEFSAPLAAQLDLDLYDFLAHTGDALLGDALLGDALHEDPLWPLLARLAGHTTPDSPAPTGAACASLLAPILPQMRAQLCRALGTGESSDESTAAAHLLCSQSARIDLSSTRLDLHFSLETHPIQIRMCGLDRNPGWVPAAGRTVAFHYE
jgi:hypothetical protein